MTYSISALRLAVCLKWQSYNQTLWMEYLHSSFVPGSVSAAVWWSGSLQADYFFDFFCCFVIHIIPSTHNDLLISYAMFLFHLIINTWSKRFKRVFSNYNLSYWYYLFHDFYTIHESHRLTEKPEPLRHRKAWSRRIDDVNRLVYNIDENGFLWIISCRGHYEDW